MVHIPEISWWMELYIWSVHPKGGLTKSWVGKTGFNSFVAWFSKLCHENCFPSDSCFDLTSQSIANLGYLSISPRISYHFLCSYPHIWMQLSPLEIVMVTPQWTGTVLAVSFALGCPKGQSPRPSHCMVFPFRPTAESSHNLNVLLDVWWWCWWWCWWWLGIFLEG